MINHLFLMAMTEPLFSNFVAAIACYLIGLFGGLRIYQTGYQDGKRSAWDKPVILPAPETDDDF